MFDNKTRIAELEKKVTALQGRLDYMDRQLYIRAAFPSMGKTQSYLQWYEESSLPHIPLCEAVQLLCDHLGVQLVQHEGTPAYNAVFFKGVDPVTK